MYTKPLLVFSSCYVCSRLILYMVLMPLTKKKYLINQLSEKGKNHYKSVKCDRRKKGILSIICGILLGIISSHFSKNESNKTIRNSSIIFTTFYSMFIIYEILWQNRFIFEERIMNEYNKDNEINEEELQDIKLYSQIYTKSRFISNIIECVCVLIAIIASFIIIKRSQ